MAVGRIKWFDDKRGYGFIEQEGGPDVFVHYSKIAGEGYKSLEKGQEVEFEVKEGDKGLHAENVTRVAHNEQ
jgi:CspA family cold shock protein